MKLIANVLCRRRYKMQFRIKKWFQRKREKRNSEGCCKKEDKESL